jgi:amino acid transporter
MFLQLLRKASSLFQKNKDGKFGTFKGVFVPNILQMVGVILFMRLGWVLGYTGIFEMTLIISLSALLLLITGLSLTAIVSNMPMEGGGAYYLISRSLGIEIGGSIGLLICVSQLASIALCVTGFSLSLAEFFPGIPILWIKASTLTMLVVISYISTDFALKTQFLIFVSLAVSILAIFFASGPVSASLPPAETSVSLAFWPAFAMFFPGMTGIESGMSMSGDLRKPSRSLPIGTLGAIGLVYIVYLSIAIFLSKHVSSDLLKGYPFILYYISKAGYLIIIGIWAATLSSALGAVLGAPRVIQALAKDRVLPGFLAKGYGATAEPRAATVAVFLLGLFITLVLDINQIIPLLTMSCLVSYGLINFIAFFESFVRNPSWRPFIRIPSAVSLTGALGCLISMFMIDPGATFIVLTLVALLCLWSSSRKIQANWDDLRHSILSFFVHRAVIKLSHLENSAKSWRPHLLAIFEQPKVSKNLAFFCHALNQEKGFLTFGTAVSNDENPTGHHESIKENLKGFKIPSHVHVNTCSSTLLGVEQMVKNYGFGLLKPNTVVFHTPENFEIDAFMKLVLDTHRHEKNVILLKQDPLRDYLFSDSKRKAKCIDLWWRGKYPGNFELCLALAYVLQQSKLWPKSKIRIKMLIADEESKRAFSEKFEEYKTKLRIKNLEFFTYVQPDLNFFAEFINHSKDADLSFLGLKKPDRETTAEEYKEYYQKLMENTKEVSNIAFVLSGEKILFHDVFSG